MFSKLLTRLFSSESPKNIPKLNQSLPGDTSQHFNYKIIAGITFGIICFKVFFHELRLNYLMKKIDEYEPKPAEYKGIYRFGFNEVLNNELKNHPVCLYGNKSTGKSQALSGYCSSQKHCIMLDTEEKWSEGLNKPGIPVNFSFFDFRLFLSAVGKLSEKYPDLVFILDGLENLNFAEIKYLVRLVKSQMSQSGRVIISSSEFENIVQLSSMIGGKFLTVPEVTKEEMHQILKIKHGYRFEDVEYLWDKCEGGLEFALDMIAHGENAEKYLEGKKENIIEHIKDLVSSPDILMRIRGTLDYKNNEKPLGDIYKFSKLAQALKERGLVKHQDPSSFCYRNKFVFMTIREYLNNQSKQ